MQKQQSYLLAGIPLNLMYQYDLVKEFCHDFESYETPSRTFCITQPMIEKERAELGDVPRSDAELEVVAFHRVFCENAIFNDVILFHSSAVMVDGKAYLFAAPAGTGKSTHANLWHEMLGDKVLMINDDKPLLKKEKDKFIVYGSPWNGKHRLGNNVSAPLAGICFLSQGKANVIRPLEVRERFPLMLPQIYRPESEEGTKIMLRLLVELSEAVPMWHLDCTISREAAKLSYNTMRSAT